jgi:DNA-binding transcriptional MerR regulator/effector-binding domain-containing protein
VFSIGEFSKITGLTVKTLRFYHEQGLLAPSCVDDETGYRYYDASKIEPARIIAWLRGLDFPLSEIAEVLRHADDDAALLAALQRQRTAIAEKLARQRKVLRELDRFLTQEREGLTMNESTTCQVQEKEVSPMLVAGVRMRGKYCDCGQGFAKIGRSYGRHICGPCFLLHYDDEYREDDADFEACMPVRQAKAVDGISVRELAGGRCAALIHRGPYDQLGQSYAKIRAYLNEKGYRAALPSREVYLKGPGMIFKGNPKHYLTEIQMLLEGEPPG